MYLGTLGISLMFIAMDKPSSSLPVSESQVNLVHSSGYTGEVCIPSANVGDLDDDLVSQAESFQYNPNDRNLLASYLTGGAGKEKKTPKDKESI